VRGEAEEKKGNLVGGEAGGMQFRGGQGGVQVTSNNLPGRGVVFLKERGRGRKEKIKVTGE